MLENFYDFPQTGIDIYSETTTYDTSTGELKREYDLDETIQAWVWQAGRSQQLISDKIIDEADFIAVAEKTLPASGIAHFKDEYYQIISPDDVLMFGEVFVIGLKRTEKPAELSA